MLYNENCLFHRCLVLKVTNFSVLVIILEYPYIFYTKLCTNSEPCANIDTWLIQWNFIDGYWWKSISVCCTSKYIAIREASFLFWKKWMWKIYVEIHLILFTLRRQDEVFWKYLLYLLQSQNCFQQYMLHVIGEDLKELKGEKMF